jgi:hypothetical protein
MQPNSWPRRQRPLVQQAVVTGRQRVVDDDLDTLCCEASELIEVAESVGERGSPRVATASGLRRLGEPERRAGSNSSLDIEHRLFDPTTLG